MSENNEPFVKFLKSKYPDIDVDAMLQLINSEIDLIRVGAEENPDNPIIKGIKCDLNKHLILGIINKYKNIPQ